jgi:hypothetical protein
VALVLNGATSPKSTIAGVSALTAITISSSANKLEPSSTLG